MQSDNVTVDLYYSLDVKSVIKEIITTIVRPGNEDEEYQKRVQAVVMRHMHYGCSWLSDIRDVLCRRGMLFVSTSSDVGGM